MTPRRRAWNEVSSADLADELWTLQHVARYLHCGRSQAFAITRSVDFPHPVAASTVHRAHLWHAGQVREWATLGIIVDTSAGVTEEPDPGLPATAASRARENQ